MHVFFCVDSLCIGILVPKKYKIKYSTSGGTKILLAPVEDEYSTTTRCNRQNGVEADAARASALEELDPAVPTAGKHERSPVLFLYPIVLTLLLFLFSFFLLLPRLPFF